MKNLALVAILAASLAGLSACGKKSSSAGITIACNYTGQDLCGSATGPQASLTTGAYTAAQCATDGGAIVASCSATNRVGRCTLSDAYATGNVTVVLHFYSPTYDTTVATQCTTLGGTWTAG